MIRHLLSLIVIFGLTGVLAPRAQTAESVVADGVLDTLIVSGSRIADGARAQVSRTVIDAAEIAIRQPANVTELLRQVAGINVIAQGGRGGLASVVMRGGESNFVVVVIDGVKVNDPTNTRGGSFDFSTLDVQSIERVEVIRGPLSSVHGADALAGVISITTLKGRGRPAATLSLGAGSDDQTTASVSLAGERGRVNYGLALSSSDDGETVAGSQYEDSTLSGRLHWQGERSRATGAVRWLDAKAGGYPEDSGGARLAVLDALASQELSEWHFGLSGERDFDSGLITKVSASHLEREDESDSPGIAAGAFSGVPPNRADTEFDRSQLTMTVAGSYPQTDWLLGVEWQRETGRATGSIDFGVEIPTDFELRRDTDSVFAEFEHRADAFALQMSARRDFADDSRAETTHKIGVQWQSPAAATAVRLSWSEAYKLPSFFALAHPLVGNPSLRPETARSWELGFAQTTADAGEFRLSVYQTDYADLIDFDPDAFTNVNRASVEAEGAELDWSRQFGDDAALSAHLSYQNTRVIGEAAELRGRPLWRGGAAAYWGVRDNARVSLSVLYLDRYFEASIPTGLVELAGYWRTDLALSMTLSKRLQAVVALDNIFGERYEEALGFRAPERHFRVRLSYSFL